MALSRRYLITLVLYISAINELRLPQVTCQDEQGSQCIPKHLFLALLRLPEVTSYLATYSKIARLVQDARDRNEVAHLMTLAGEGDEAEVCIPSTLYFDLFRDPLMREYLDVIERTQRLPNSRDSMITDSDESDNRDLYSDSQKRSIATLAKNGDLPITVSSREESDDDEEKRSIAVSEEMDTILRKLLDDDARKVTPEILRDYTLPSGEIDIEALTRDYGLEKRNVGTLARDYALPNTRRNIASLARDYALPSGKRNIGALARDRMLPYSGKRNVAALARDYALPYGKRYLGALARVGALPYQENKRSVSALARNSDWPEESKRGLSVPARILFRSLNRHSIGSNPRKDILTLTRSKRQIDFSDEYPLPVMQNTNVLDYEEMMEALGERYPNTEKRFMGIGSASDEKQTDVKQIGYPELFQENKRHIAALARLGWLPFRPVRVSRSPRDIIGRENPSNGSASNHTPESPTRTLRRNFHPSARNLQALHRYCYHSFPRSRFSGCQRQILYSSPRRL